MPAPSDPHRVVILGGGFGGLYTAKQLGGAAGIELTLVDRRNFHLFQPLLYQVATGGLAPGDIGSPLRAVLNRFQNVRVVQSEVRDIDVEVRSVATDHGALPYDTLVVATGASHHYFGNDQWAPAAPGLKTIEDALVIRGRVFNAYEEAEWEPDAQRRAERMTFLVVGAGATGIELAGAIGELASTTLRHDFRNIRPPESRILLVEGAPRVLPGFPPALSAKAERQLRRLGVSVLCNTLVQDIAEGAVTLRHGDGASEQVRTRNVFWAAGVRASSLGRLLAKRAGAELDAVGRVVVTPQLTVPGRPELLVLGDLAHCAGRDGAPLPGLAAVAIQQGGYTGRLIRRRLRGQEAPPFRYRDKGMLAVIGRNAAVAALPGLHVSGFLAWLIWLFVHIRYLIGFDSKLLVLIQWSIDYLTRKRGSRLITGGAATRPAPPARGD